MRVLACKQFERIQMGFIYVVVLSKGVLEVFRAHRRCVQRMRSGVRTRQALCNRGSPPFDHMGTTIDTWVQKRIPLASSFEGLNPRWASSYSSYCCFFFLAGYTSTRAAEAGSFPGCSDLEVFNIMLCGIHQYKRSFGPCQALPYH